MIRRLLITTALALIGSAVGLAAVVAADKPIKEPPVPVPDDTGQFCEDFQVRIHETQNKGSTITFSDGRALIAGALKLELTNVETGKTIAVNASGPLFFSADGATVTLRGATLLSGEAGFFGPGSEPRLSLVGGVVVVDLETGAILSERGRSTDLCPILADP